MYSSITIRDEFFLPSEFIQSRCLRNFREKIENYHGHMLHRLLIIPVNTRVIDNAYIHLYQLIVNISYSHLCELFSYKNITVINPQ